MRFVFEMCTTQVFVLRQAQLRDDKSSPPCSVSHVNHKAPPAKSQAVHSGSHPLHIMQRLQWLKI